MSSHLGNNAQAAVIKAAVFATLASGPRTPDLGGTDTTTQVRLPRMHACMYASSHAVCVHASTHMHAQVTDAVLAHMKTA